MSRIGVVTVTYQSGSVLQPFLECCAQQAGVDWTLYVIDNASRDATREILAREAHPQMRVVLNSENLGVAEGNNQGIRAALADGCTHVLLINNDVEFPPTLFQDMLASLEQHQAHALTPRITYHDEQHRDWFNGGRFQYAWGPDARHVEPADPAERQKVRTIGYAPTCCMLVEAEVFARIGMMDPAYFVYWDDTDFCLRMQRAGLRLVCDPGLSMSHKVSSLTGGLSSDFFIRHHHRNQVYYVRKHFGSGVLAYTLAASVLKAVLRVPLRGDTLRQFRLRLRSMADGLRMPLQAGGR